jgi:rhodanese-related sulfurtransferase
MKTKTISNVVIDLRSPAAFKFGSVAGAKNVTFRGLHKELLTLDKNTRLLFLDEDVKVAETASLFALSLGFVHTRATTLADWRLSHPGT